MRVEDAEQVFGELWQHWGRGEVVEFCEAITLDDLATCPMSWAFATHWRGWTTPSVRDCAPVADQSYGPFDHVARQGGPSHPLVISAFHALAERVTLESLR